MNHPIQRAMIRPLAFSIALLTGASALAQDTILKKDGSSMRGIEIQSLELSGAKIVKSGSELEIPPHQIADVSWGGVRDNFNSGHSALARGDYAAATSMFGEAIGQAGRDLVKVDAQFYQGKAAAMGAGGDQAAVANAAGVLRAWVEANPSHWRLPEAMLLLGHALRLSGVAAEATQTLDLLYNRAGAEGWGAHWTAHAKYELALTHLADGKAIDARTAFQAATSAADSAITTKSGSTAEMQQIKINSQVGEGETLIAEQDYRRAEDFFRTMSSDRDLALAAAGKAGQGQAMFLSAGDDLDQVRRAQLVLAEASVFDSTGGEASAKANYFLGKCLLALGADREGDQYRNRAQAYFKIVVASYPTSIWAGKARQEPAE